MNHWKNVPGWFNCPDLYQSMVDNAPLAGAVFIEVGSWKGKSSSYMAEAIKNSGKNIEFYCVDTWAGTPGEHDEDIDVINNQLMEVFENNMSPFSEYYTAVRKPSVEAAKDFLPGTADFIYIDADHSYEAVKEDIESWLPILKKGGVIAGDDYNSRLVSRAVHEKLGSVKVPNRFTFYKVIN